MVQQNADLIKAFIVQGRAAAVEREVKAREQQAESSSNAETYSACETLLAVRRLDFLLVPLLSTIYLFAYIDRGNIGNAYIAGMNEDLDLSSDQYAWLISIFYIAYVSFQCLIFAWRIFDPPTWVALMVVGFGSVSILQATATKFSALMILRFLLGVFESGYAPGVAFYMSWFYTRSEIALRYGLFLGSAALGNAVASLLAYGIVHADVAINSWKLLFIVEGAPSLLVAAIAFMLLPSGPHSIRTLSPQQVSIIEDRAARVRNGAIKDTRVDLLEASKVLFDYTCWMQGSILFCLTAAFASLPAFLPTIIKELGYSSVEAQGLAAPPYVVGYVVCIMVCFISDHLSHRGCLIGIAALLAGIGYLLLRLMTRTSIRYSAIYLITSGVYTCMSLMYVWVTDNQMTVDKRGAGLILFATIGQCGTFLGARMFPKEQAPFFRHGMTVLAGLMFAACALAMALTCLLTSANRRMRKAEIVEQIRLYIC